MSHDEKKYQEPHGFNPGRFLDANGNLNNDDRILAYGFGRRSVWGAAEYESRADEAVMICVGKHMGSTSVRPMPRATIDFSMHGVLIDFSSADVVNNSVNLSNIHFFQSKG